MGDFRERPQSRDLSFEPLRNGKHARDRPFSCFEHLYDSSLVRSSPLQERGPLARDPDQLADRVRGVLFPGSGEPHGVLSVLHRAAQNDPGSDHAGGLLRFFCSLPERRIKMELLGRLWFHDHRCFLCF